MKKNILLPIFSFLLLGCVNNPGQGVYYLDSDSLPSLTKAPENVEPAEEEEEEFENCHALDYIEGYQSTDGLRHICVARKIDAHKKLRLVSKPGLSKDTAICIITGLQYDPNSVPQGTADYVIDIDEAVCDKADSTFTLRRTDYNTLTIVLKTDFQRFKDYIYGTSDDYPSIADGQIAGNAQY